MAKQATILPQEQLSSLEFPLQGLNVATVYDQQPPGTTPVGLNVRSFEALTSRARGGSRPGLSRYIDAQVSGSNKIQHLAVIVDPQAEALAGAGLAGDPNQNSFNRNAVGGLLGFQPVRWPVEPGRTYPAVPTQPPPPPPHGVWLITSFSAVWSLGDWNLSANAPNQSNYSGEIPHPSVFGARYQFASTALNLGDLNTWSVSNSFWDYPTFTPFYVNFAPTGANGFTFSGPTGPGGYGGTPAIGTTFQSVGTCPMNGTFTNANMTISYDCGEATWTLVWKFTKV